MRWVWWIALAWGCGSERFEIPGLREPPCELESSYYVVDSIRFPETSVGAELGLDLDLDGRADNGLGASRQNLARDIEDSPIDLDVALAASIENHNLIWIIELQRCAGGDSGHLRVHSRRGLELAGDLETGAEVLLAQRIEPTGLPPAVGACDGVRCQAEHGFGIAPLAAFADSRAAERTVVWTEGMGLAVKLELEDQAIEGRLGVGFLPAVAFYDLLEPFTRTLDDVVQSDTGCPEACETEAGQTMTETFDANRDQRITVDEVLENRIFLDLAVAFETDLLADVDGQRIYWPGFDARLDSSALGIGLRARQVTALNPP